MRKLIIVVSGPSGSGKTTLINSLFRDKFCSQKLVRSVSATTRPQRTGEKEGIHYFFLSEPEFLRRRRAKKILEWTKYLGYYYGTPKEFVEEQFARGKGVILCLDFRGAIRIRNLYPKETVAIFVTPGSLASLPERMEKRCSKTAPEEIKRRIRLAQQELKNAHEYNYCVINEDLKTAVHDFKKIIKNEIRKRLKQ